MAQEALHDAQARLDQLQKQRDEAFSAWRANPSSDLEKECYEDLKISLHKGEDAVNSLAAAAASTSGGRIYCDQQVCILSNEVLRNLLVMLNLVTITSAR
jgi:hypothetical protein